MSNSLKRIAAGAAAAGLVAVGMAATAGSASAAGAPAYEPDAYASVGYISFYNSAGQKITGGTNFAHLADYALVSGAGRTGATKAALYFGVPDHTKPTNAWGNVSLVSGSTTFPSAAAPAPLNSATTPLVTLGATDANLQSLLATATLDTTAGYANYIEVRVKDSGIGLPAPTTYAATDIEFNNNALGGANLADGLAPQHWQVVYPNGALGNPTTTTVTATPVSGATNEQTVFFSAAVAGNTGGGTVKFYNGDPAGTPAGTQIGASKSVSGPGSVDSDTVTLPAGSYNIYATFTPTGGTPATDANGSTLAADLASQGSLTGYTVTLVTHATSTTLSLDSTSTPTVSEPTPITGKAVVSETGAGNVTSGTVAFFADGSATAFQSGVAYDASKNGFPFSLASSGLNATGGAWSDTSTTPATPQTTGAHTIVAVFTPASSTTHQLNGSTSSAATATVGKSTYKSDVQAIETAINPGTITITTPYGGDTGLCAVGTDPSVSSVFGKVYLKSAPTVALTDSAPCGFLFLPAMTLSGDASQYSTSGTFNNIQVNDSRPGNNPWTLSAQSSNLNKAGVGSPGVNEIINSQNVGLTGLVWDGSNNLSLSALNYTFTPQPVPAVAVGSSAAGTAGLGNAPHPIVHAAVGLGTSVFHGNLTIEAPSSTRDGVYTGTVTFTVLGS